MPEARAAPQPFAASTELSMPDVSVVLPIHDEAPVLKATLDVVRDTLVGSAVAFEIVCVDDGSVDGSTKLLAAFAETDQRIRYVPLSRNFGKEAALAAGLSTARGRAVVLMDADLQHPPELLPKMLELWQSGYDVVNAVKQARARESFSYRFMAWLFNVLIGGAAGSSFKGASDFKLLDRQVVEAVLECPERNRFFRGLVAWVGFSVVDVPFSVAPRAAGTTKWSTWGLVAYSVRNLLAFSSLPLRLVAVAGFVTLILSLGLAVQTLYRYVRGDALSGFTTVILLQLLLGGLLLTSVGVIALYLSEIYDEVKRRPVFVIRRPRGATGENTAERRR